MGKTVTIRRHQRSPAIDAKLTRTKDIDATIDKVLYLYDQLQERDKIKLLNALGVGRDGQGKYFTCYVCGRPLKKDEFYQSTEAITSTHITPTCKECATKIAAPPNSEGVPTPTRTSVITALSLLRKPFLESVWDSSIEESSNKNIGKTKNNVWTSYIKNISMNRYYTYNFESSDFHGDGEAFSGMNTGTDSVMSKAAEMNSMFKQNKDDVVRLLGYEPFANEKLTDQPFLYSQLLGLLDTSEDANDDLMRVSSAISIVRGFLQQSVIDDKIAKLLQDARAADKNAPTLKSYLEMKKNLSATISTLAEDSCISLKHNKNAKKGENTWTGKLKKIKDLNLRAGEVNGFDIATCKGMRQVMDASHASIIQQLRLDESEWSDMLADQRTMIVGLQRDLENYKEIARILLRENLDLRDTLEDSGLLVPSNLIDLNELYSPFADNLDSTVIDITEEQNEGDTDEEN